MPNRIGKEREQIKLTDKKYGRYIRIEDTTWPDPDIVGEMNHRLRYGPPLERGDLLFVAEALGAYCHLANGRGKYGRESLARLWRGVRLAEDELSDILPSENSFKLARRYAETKVRQDFYGTIVIKEAEEEE